MVFKTTSIRVRHRLAAFSLVELLVSIGIGSILLLTTSALMFYSGRSFAGLANYVDLEAQSRNALDRMAQEIRQTQELLSFETNKLVFLDHDGKQLSYIYNADSKTLSRVKEQSATVLLLECDYLMFDIFQRNPIGGTYDQYSTASPATCKLVQLTWICSRKILGKTLNTESVQSAKIVIRKQ